MRTVVGVLPVQEEAERVAHDLNAIGIAADDIYIVGGADQHDHDAEWTRRNIAAAAGCGWGWLIAAFIPAVVNRSRAAAVGFGAGFGGGILAGLTALAIRNATQISAVDDLAIIGAALGAGALGGGIAAGVYNAGVSREGTPLREEAVREHGVVVAAHVEDPREEEALLVMNAHGARNIRGAAEAWLASGSTRAHEKETLYPSDSTIRTH